ncbi:hypothetical protein RJ640_013900 [Escallonia rubra]|uniref:Reverse transcriptase/retrotransposon-derived protein RNase H-like domain-containing protein n=1 Tax=Escallonia rubra TaxID=112253 RepID=A0AA88SPF8_9ASTE|nr:hypothetical protein RJ640_013900 [Escallonia rubra]
MVKMFQKFGLDCTSTHNPPPFETMMNEEQVDALLTGRILKHSRRGLGCRDSKSFVKKIVNTTSYATECEDSSPAPSEYEEGGQATIDELMEAFDRIKDYLMKSPVLMAHVKGKPMILYTAAMDTSLEALLAQHNDQGKENVLYYLSRTFVRAELRSPDGEKQMIQGITNLVLG